MNLKIVVPFSYVYDVRKRLFYFNENNMNEMPYQLLTGSVQCSVSCSRKIGDLFRQKRISQVKNKPQYDITNIIFLFIIFLFKFLDFRCLKTVSHYNDKSWINAVILKNKVTLPIILEIIGRRAVFRWRRKRTHRQGAIALVLSSNLKLALEGSNSGEITRSRSQRKHSRHARRSSSKNY